MAFPPNWPTPLLRISPSTFVFILLILPILNALGRPTLGEHSLKWYTKRSTELRDLQEMFAQQPPHCSRATVSVAAPSISPNFSVHDSSPQQTTPRMRLNAGVGNTVCFRTPQSSSSNDSSPVDVLHTLTLVRLEQYYPISQRFRFAIPEVETRCFCECQADAKICQPAEYSFGKCPDSPSPSSALSTLSSPEACHRTFFASQPTNGCPNGHAEEPKICCELRFRAYQNRTFTALRLESPSTFGVLRYTAYEWTERGRWSQVDRRAISIHLDGSTQTQFLDSLKNIELAITSPGQSNNQLEAGMYFVENLPRCKYGELRRQPLNEITEHNFEKLGWFRVNPENSAYVQGGFVLMDKIHKAKAENCLEQKYQSILDANYYVNKEDDGRQGELCRLATTLHLALETNTVQNRWHGVKGVCVDCNQFTMEGFMHFLNPANWVKGVHSVGDAVMLLSDIVGYVFVILLAYLLIFKLLIPLIRCFACPFSMVQCGTGGKK